MDDRDSADAEALRYVKRLNARIARQSEGLATSVGWQNRRPASRRQVWGQPPMLDLQRLSMFPRDAAKRVPTASGEVRLTPTEWHIVEMLVRNAGNLVSASCWQPARGDRRQQSLGQDPLHVLHRSAQQAA
jgi:hypothetical protein